MIQRLHHLPAKHRQKILHCHARFQLRTQWKELNAMPHQTRLTGGGLTGKWHSHQKIRLAAEPVQQNLPSSQQDTEEGEFFITAILPHLTYQFAGQIQPHAMRVVTEFGPGVVHWQQQGTGRIGQLSQPIGSGLGKFSGRPKHALLCGVGIKARRRFTLETLPSPRLRVGHWQLRTDHAKGPPIAGQVMRGQQEQMIQRRQDHQSRAQQRRMGKGERHQEMVAFDFLQPQLLLRR